MAPFFALGSDPFAAGLPTSTVATQSAPTIFGLSLPSLPELPKLSEIPGVSTVESVGGFLGKLTSGNLWERVGFVILGIIFIGIALFMMANKTTIIQTAVRAATIAA